MRDSEPQRSRRRAQRVAVGSQVPPRTLVTIAGVTIDVPDDERLVHMQLRRFAGCPVCNLHLQSVVRRHDEIAAAGIREVVVFHSPSDELRLHAGDLPFAVIADPEKHLYAEFGAEASPRAMLDPRAWLPIVRGVTRSLWAIVRRKGRPPALIPQGGRFGLPAEFLVARDGTILACRYGEHVYDQWSVDELLAVVASQPDSVGRQPRG